jgi:hypothetical protein
VGKPYIGLGLFPNIDRIRHKNIFRLKSGAIGSEALSAAG